MLPAISADLPVYLLPPRGGPDDRPPQEESRFGPAARVDVQGQSGDSVQDADPFTGLYGPDGQFVEAGGRREIDTQADSTRDRPAPPTERPEEPTARTTTTKSDQDANAAAPLTGGTIEHPQRDLSLTEFDVAVPPAAREELRDLADRINRRSNNGSLSANDYVRIADLMERIGRFDEAQRARIEADALQQNTQGSKVSPDEQPGPTIGEHQDDEGHEPGQADA